ncbi:MAG: inorganic phosphate transporter [Gammaproteobacteria bacterium]|nr:inorganic phosphate transporter [Gammaproteobacteria bacterium]MCW8839742.1 inorganic phosphate transporter [Gammaproteobacteria bacterium]MCW8928039.1 inorganic phosphate transporter [Gammaproteobacteria bacterium]MCW8957967.1 inorganic phosphate transporter [Gammaproteobacteria bacterium]MCW8973965.1 inorganic phosphate transporter [Gammaproteobacteria bacterium]
MAWGVGANDVANAMGTSVGSKAVTIKQAFIIAAVFEFSGAFLAGGEVTKTIRKGMIDPDVLAASPDLVVFGMLAALLAAGIWLLVASRAGWPVSTTHSIVGAIVGFAAVGIGMEAVQWGKVGTIVMSWVISPALAGVISYWLFVSVQRLILDTPNPLASAKRYVPFYIFLVGFIIALVTVYKGLKHVGLHLSTQESYVAAVVLGLAVMVIGVFFIRRLKFDPAADADFHFANVEKVFGVLMIFTACAMAFAHGSNDVANAVGPVAAVVGIAQTGSVAAETVMPAWILLLGGVGIVIGLVTYGHRVIATVGTGITELTPSRGFAATLGAATTVVIASGTGLPISTTHTLVGAVLGVGLARGIAALNLNVVRTIFLSWIVTLPAGAILAIIFFFMLKGIFS